MFRKKLVEAPLGYWEEKSYMSVIPKEDKDNLIDKSFERIATIDGVKIVETNYNMDGYIYVKLDYDGVEYEVGFYPGHITIPEYYLNKNFLFSKEEREELLKTRNCINVFMEFKENVKKSYHLQLKLAVAMVPDLLGVLDESAEKVLPAKWVSLMASSKVLPSATDLFSVQAVEGKDGKVWLHTHGLCRALTTELEILESDKDNYRNHYNLLSTYAMYLIDKKEKTDPRSDDAYIGRLVNGNPVVVTCRSWTEGVLEYKKLKLGGVEDRKNGHNSKTSIVFLYISEEDEKNGVLSKVSVYDNLWGDNPLFFFSDEETERMKALARERFEYVKKCSKDKDNSILIKIGLPLKEKGSFEHIWFELLEVKGNKFKAKLTQEPYDIPDIHTGYEAWYGIDDVTDWMIYTPLYAVNPSNVYLLEQ